MYVDDILIAGKRTAAPADIKSKLEKQVVMKDLGHPDVYLGITIKRSAKSVNVSLIDFFSKLAMDYEIHKENTIATPLAKGFEPTGT